MALALSSSKVRHRFDSSVYPVFTPSGITGIGKLFIYAKNSTNLYVPVTNGVEYEYSPPNESSIRNCALRNVSRPSWNLGTNVALDSLDPKKSTANSNSGAWVSEMDVNCAIEGVATANDKRCGISLQSGSISYNNSGAHCLILQDDGYCAVYENNIRLDYTLTQYSVGDGIFIDKQGSFIRYYLIKNNKPILLRTTRSTLDDGDIRGVIILYHIDAKISNAFIYANESTSLTIETVGVLQNFLSWLDEYALVSTAIALIGQDSNPHFTRANGKRWLRQLSPSRSSAGKTERLNFTDFFKHHTTDKEFIFIDNSKKDANNRPESFWARFTSSFNDKTRANCQSIEGSQIQETFRKDNIPLEFYDDTAPSTPEFSFTDLGGGTVRAEWTESVDDETEIISYILTIKLGT